MYYLINRVLLLKALSCDRLPEEIWCSLCLQQIYMYSLYEVWTPNFRKNLHRAWDRRTLLFLLYNAKFWAKKCWQLQCDYYVTKKGAGKPQGDWRAHGSHFNARSSFLIIYVGNGSNASTVFTENCQKRAIYADRRPLRRDTIASRDRFPPMGACVVLYSLIARKKPWKAPLVS